MSFQTDKQCLNIGIIIKYVVNFTTILSSSLPLYNHIARINRMTSIKNRIHLLSNELAVIEKSKIKSY